MEGYLQESNEKECQSFFQNLSLSINDQQKVQYNDFTQNGMNVQQAQQKSSGINSNSMYSSTPANLSTFPHQNSVPLTNNNPANAQTTNNLRQYQGSMPAKVSPHMYQQTFPQVASTIVNANTYKPPTMPPTNGDQLSNGVPSNKDWNTASTTQPRNGEFAAAPFSNAVGGSVGNGNCSNQQQLSHQSVTGVHQVGGLQNRLMTSGPSPGNQSMYHHSNTFQHLGWGSTDNQRSTFSITGQNPPPLRSSATSSVIGGPVVSTQNAQMSWLPQIASNANYHQQPRANILNQTSNMQQYQSRQSGNSMGGTNEMMVGMLKGNTQQSNNHDFTQSAASIQQQASPWNNNQYVQPDMVSTQQHDNTWAHQTSHQQLYNRQVAPRSVAMHETSVIGQQASSFHGDSSQTTVQQNPGAQAAWNAAGFMQQQQQDFMRQGQQHTMRSDNNWQNTNIDVNNLWQPVHPDRNQNQSVQDFQMSNKFKYQNTSGSQMIIGKSRSEVKGKQLWDPNNKSQPPPVVHSNQQLVDKRKTKAPDVMKLMEEFGKTSINQNEAPKKIVPRPNTSRNLIMSLSEKFQRSEEIAKLKSFMERNNLSTKLATNNVNGAKWVVELKFNEKYENLVGVGDSVDQKDAVEKAVCCLLNELEKSGLIDNKNKTKSDITILKNTSLTNNAKNNMMKNNFGNPDNRRYKNIRPNTNNIKNNAVTNNVVANNNKQQNNVPIPPPFIFNNGHQGNHPRPPPHHEPMPWYPYGPPPPMGPNFRPPMGQNFRPHFDHGIHPMGPPMMFNGPRPMMPQPYHPMMMPHHIHGNHPMMYPQPPHQHPINFMDPDMDDEEMFPSADSFIDRMIMNQREAAMQTGEMFDGPNMRLGDDWNNSKQVKMSLDDRHVYDKHNQIYPSKSELDAFEKIVGVTEKVLKKLSDKFVNEDYPITSPEAKQDLGSGDGSSKAAEVVANQVQVEKGAGDEPSPTKLEQKPKVQILKRPKKSSSTTNVLDDRPRILNGVSRVGHLSKGLIIKGDNVVEIIAYCGEVPTSKLLDRVMEHIPGELNKASQDLICKVERTEAGFNVIAESQFKITLAVTMTWVKMDSRREKQNGEVEEKKKDEETSSDDKNGEEITLADKKNEDISMIDLPENVLSEKLQLEALAKVRQAKWFQQHASRMETCMTVIRIFRDMQNRVEAWKSLPCWTLEVIVYKALISSNEQMSTADAFRRVLEVIAGGLLMPDGPGIKDPCEKGEQDILATCHPQVLEDITAFAQTSLSLIAFRAIHQVLDVPRIAAVKPIIFSNNARPGLVEKIVIKQKEKEDEKISNQLSNENSVKCDKPENETKETSQEQVLTKE